MGYRVEFPPIQRNRKSQNTVFSPGSEKVATVATNPYAECMQAALREINRAGYPAGMIVWLGENAPGLYAKLTEDLPNEIDRLWNTHAPIAQFQETLRRLVKLHAQCCEFYHQHIVGTSVTRLPRESSSGSTDVADDCRTGSSAPPSTLIGSKQSPNYGGDAGDDQTHAEDDDPAKLWEEGLL